MKIGNLSTGTTRASIIASIIIVTLISIFFGIASLLSKILNLPSSLDLPIILRVVGAMSLTVGVSLAIWLFRYRNPAIMIMSTYFTFRKLFRRAPIEELSGRMETLVILGPQKYVRHPLYLGAIIIFFGWGLLTDTTYVLIATVVVVLWFRLVQIPFEERELCALFGDQYVRYMDNIPMLVPFTKRKRRADTKF